MATSSPAIVLMAKWPEAGRAKTRLSPPLTPEQAATFAKAMLLDSIDSARESGAACYIACSPGARVSALEDRVGRRAAVFAAEGTHLGAALATAQREAFDRGHVAVALVAPDVPHAGPAIYRRVFEELRRRDVVLGLCDDGGYYAVATRRLVPSLFEPMAWGTGAVGTETVRRARAAGFDVGFVPALRDIDTFDDLLAVTTVLKEVEWAGRTRAFVRSLAEVAGAATR
jgi:rSAM/selenodomain-associated transferase 1